jgi:hypothetical protein
MLHRTSNRAAAVVITGAATLGLAASADAKTHRLAGTQVVVDPDAGASTMPGVPLVDWALTEFREVATSPRYRADRQTRGIRTDYIGSVTLVGDRGDRSVARAATARSASPRTCGAMG